MKSAAYVAFHPDDAPLGEEAAAVLQAAGLPAVIGPHELRRPETAPQLAQAVAEAGCLVVIASPAGTHDPWIAKEAAIAAANGRPVIALVGAGGEETALAKGAQERIHRDEAWREALQNAVRAFTGPGRVVAMLNIKGGVGKTILGANLFAAAHLVDGRSVALVDLDPQHNLTQYFLPPEERNRLRSDGVTIYDVFSGRAALDGAGLDRLATPLNRSRRAANGPRFDLIMGDERLFEYTLDDRTREEQALAFSRVLQLVTGLRRRYDVIALDANPCATFLTRCAIAGADHIVAPVRPEKYSLTGLNMLEQVTRHIRARALRPSEFSVLLNGVNDRTRISSTGDADAATRGEISSAPFFASTLLATAIPYSGALRAVPADRFATNPINVTAMMRERQRDVKESLVAAAAEILRRAGA